MKTNNLSITGALCVGSIGADDSKAICMQSNELLSMIKFYKQKDRMYNTGALIYQNIFDSLSSGVIAKSCTPVGWNQTSFAVNPWNGFLIDMFIISSITFFIKIFKRKIILDI
jgi:hypothetical protein